MNSRLSNSSITIDKLIENHKTSCLKNVLIKSLFHLYLCYKVCNYRKQIKINKMLIIN